MEQRDYIRPGWYLRVADPGKPGKVDYVFVEQRESALYNFAWPADIAVGTEDGPRTVEDLKPLALDTIYQCWFGVKGPSYVYFNLPTGSRLNGTGRVPAATSTIRELGWWTEDTTPYWSPNPDTEFFLMKGGNYEFPGFSAYNPTFRARRPWVRVVMNKLIVSPVKTGEILRALQDRRVPAKPVSFGGIGSIRSGPGGA